MAEEDVNVKVSKYEERQNFLKEIDEKVKLNESVEAKIRELVERNEEIAARNLLGGKTESVQPEPLKEETAKEYLDRVIRTGQP